MKAEKGYFRLPRTIRRLLAFEEFPICFVVHVPKSELNGREQEVLDELLKLERTTGALRVEHSDLNAEEFASFIDGLDALVLDYDGDAYANRTSGIAVVAAGLGVPTLFTQDCLAFRDARLFGRAGLLGDGDIASAIRTLEFESYSDDDVANYFARVATPILDSISEALRRSSRGESRLRFAGEDEPRHGPAMGT